MEWIWGSTDTSRAARATKVKVLSMNESSEPFIECEGSGGSRYHASLTECSCPDFIMNQKKGKPGACKHMVCLAMRLGFLNKEGLTEKDQFASDFRELETRLALASWHYYVLDEPDISDDEYDLLKADYLDRLEKVRSWR